MTTAVVGGREFGLGMEGRGMPAPRRRAEILRTHGSADGRTSEVLPQEKGGPSAQRQSQLW
jgi:hypothetical protein